MQEHLSTLNSLCLVLGLDINVSVSEVPFNTCNSGGTGDISTSAIKRLTHKIENLREIKLQRMQKVALQALDCVSFPEKSIIIAATIVNSLSTATRFCNYNAGSMEFDGYTR